MDLPSSRISKKEAFGEWFETVLWNDTGMSYEEHGLSVSSKDVELLESAGCLSGHKLHEKRVLPFWFWLVNNLGGMGTLNLTFNLIINNNIAK